MCRLSRVSEILLPVILPFVVLVCVKISLGVLLYKNYMYWFIVSAGMELYMFLSKTVSHMYLWPLMTSCVLTSGWSAWGVIMLGYANDVDRSDFFIFLFIALNDWFHSIASLCAFKYHKYSPVRDRLVSPNNESSRVNDYDNIINVSNVDEVI